MKYNMCDFLRKFENYRFTLDGSPYTETRVEFDYDLIHDHILKPISNNMKSGDKLTLFIHPSIQGFRFVHTRNNHKIGKYTFNFNKVREIISDIEETDFYTSSFDAEWYVVELGCVFEGYKPLEKYLPNNLVGTLDMYITDWSNIFPE